ncbi:MAG TPA: type II secretion system protein [Noviherbaspirillum sp.]|nr:type II secretion system protein [Noviherbaspirillum sp.]
MKHRKYEGFNLVELVIVIAITGVIAAASVVFFKPAIDAYFDSSRRAELTDFADTALRRIARDVRSAVPNSIRSPNNQCFELVPTSAGGRFRTDPDTVNDSGPNCVPGPGCSAPLDLTQPATVFDVLSPLSSVPAVSDWVVIGNQNTNDVYAASSPTRARITAVATPNVNFGTQRITITSTQFPAGYDGGRFTIVPNNGGSPAIVYVCSNPGTTSNGDGTGTVFRVARAFDATYPTACPDTTGGAVVVTRVSRCNFVYTPNQGETQQSGFVWMELELAEKGESISLSFGAHVDNVP